MSEQQKDMPNEQNSDWVRKQELINFKEGLEDEIEECNKKIERCKKAEKYITWGVIVLEIIVGVIIIKMIWIPFIGTQITTSGIIIMLINSIIDCILPLLFLIFNIPWKKEKRKCIAERKELKKQLKECTYERTEVI